MNATTDPQATCPHNRGMVHLQGNYSAAPGARTAEDARAIGTPNEMSRPTLFTGIEEWCRLSAHRIRSTRTLTFVEVAACTGVGKIGGIGDASLRSWPYVLDMERPASKMFGAVAVLTAITGPVANLLA